MSGTSLDGVDASIIRTDGDSSCQIIENFYYPYPKDFTIKLRLLLDDYAHWLQIEFELTQYHIEAVKQLLKKAKLNQNDVDIIGFHGQTILHDPSRTITWQIGNPHLIAAAFDTDVVSDFRRNDVANGGNGAPLVPIFHKCLMQKEQKPVAVLNIGGVANITYISDEELIAFDTGPGSALINDAMVKYYTQPYDDCGSIAKSGQVIIEYIIKFLKQPFFKLSFPKSLDRNDFVKNINFDYSLKPADVVATLTFLTIETIILAIESLPSVPKKIYVAGGGVKNNFMIDELKLKLKDISIELHYLEEADFIESQAFGFLAVRYLKSLPSSFSSTTGVIKERPVGVLFPR